MYFLLTSTPDRSARLPSLLDTLRRQTLMPTRVILTIARRYDATRFRNPAFEMPSAVFRSSASLPRLDVHTIDTDRGPLSKYFGVNASAIDAIDSPHTRLSARSHAIAVVGDDDMFYGTTFVEDYACAVARAPAGTVFSSGIDFDCGKLRTCVMGFRGVAMRVPMLAALPSMNAWPHECLLADDVVITYYLVRCNSFNIRRLKLRSKYKFDDAFAWSNSSINTYHRQRRFGVNRACTMQLHSHRRAALCGPS